MVIQKKMMGDILMSSVLFKQLRQKFPQANLHYLISKMGHDVVLNNPTINDYIFFDDYDFPRLLKKIKSENYDYIIDAYGKTATAILSFLSGAKSISYRKGYTQFFYNQTIKRRSQHQSIVTTKAIEHRLQLLEPLGISFEEVVPDIFITPTEKESAIESLRDCGVNDDDKLIMISTFGSNESKTYPLNYMAQVIEQVAAFPVKVILNHRAGEEEKVEKIKSFLSRGAQQKIVEGVQLNSLRKFIGVCSRCAALIGNEGGSTNISKALRVPTFSVFAPFVGKDGWFWGENGTTNVSVHVRDFISDSEKQNHENFKPVLFKELLNEFLERNL